MSTTYSVINPFTQHEYYQYELTSINEAGFSVGKDITLAMDCAASEFYHDGVYDYKIFEGPGGKSRSSLEQVDYLKELVDNYPIDSIEDGCDEIGRAHV